MKNMLVLFTALFFFGGSAYAQKYAYVNTQYILEKIPEYQEAQKKIDNLSEQWQKDVEARFAEVEKLYQAYQKEQILLPDDMKKKREEEIIQKEREAKEFQKQIFGVNGELFQKRQELIKPIQDRIYKAIQEVAEQGGFTFIFDKANSSTILYADPKTDRSDAVLKKLGL